MQDTMPSLGRRVPPGTIPRIIGHRGCADQYPENTIAAISAAAPRVDGFEIDVRPCGTGELVVFHDETLERVTERTGHVADTSLAELRELDVLGSGEPIPTLEELLAAVPPGLPVNVELKATGIETDVLATCRGSDVPVLYSSFFESALRNLRRMEGSAPIAVLCHEAVDDRLALASELDAVAFHPSVELALETDVVAAAHDLDLAVNVWTAETEDEMRRLRECGVDGIFVDRCDLG